VSLDHINRLPPRVILWGGTGQAKVVRPIIERFGAKVVAVFDDTPGLKSPFADVPIYPGKAGFDAWRGEHDATGVGFCIAIGNPHGRVRIRLHDELVALGLVPTTIAHPSAVIEPNAEIGEGSQLMAGAIVGAEARLGRQCIINTKASVDHEDVLADGVELAPGATLCGLVEIGIAGWICTGATVLPRVRIGADAIVGAGAVVRHHVPDGAVVIGVPAIPKPKRSSE
jgi:sugar O-acyltransferase (sialic acid O-acetyltransferase NeuD family)